MSGNIRTLDTNHSCDLSRIRNRTQLEPETMPNLKRSGMRSLTDICCRSCPQALNQA